MARLVRMLVATLLSAGLFVVPMKLLDPPPIPALTALVGGLLVAWLGGRRVGALLVGLLVGAIAGSAVHAHSHWSEDRIDAAGAFAAHLARDAGVGLAIAAAILVLALGLSARISGPKVDGREASGAG